MTIARIARAAAIAAAGALATAGAANAAPPLSLGVDNASGAASEATPVHHYGYGPYYKPYYKSHYAPYGYGPYGYAPPPPPRYYSHGYHPYGYYHRPRSHGRVFISTPGLRLGIGW